MARRSQRVRGGAVNRGGGNPGQSSPPNQGDVDPNLLAAVNRAMTDMLPQVVAQAMQAIYQQSNQGGELNQGGQPNQGGSGSGNGGGGGEVVQPNTAMHVWLERFQKQKPQSFSSAPTPIDAENWVTHLDKIFDVLGCSDNQKVRLAAYKFEGDAHRWWKTYKQVKGGEAFVEALTWAEFCEAFYQQYFPAADKDAYARQYSSIRQGDDESVTDYLARFVRLAGFAGAAAGTAVEQAEKFKWTIQYRYRSKLINEKFSDVAQATNAAKNIEMERIDYQTSKSKGSKKRNRDGQQIQRGAHQEQMSSQQGGNRGGQWNRNRGNQQGQWRGQNQGLGQQQAHRQYGQQGQNQSRYPESTSRGNPNFIPVAPCNTCGKRHPGNPCYKETGACYSCGQIGHLARDCQRPRNGNAAGNKGNGTQQNTGGRVFALTANQAAAAPGIQGDRG